MVAGDQVDLFGPTGPRHAACDDATRALAATLPPRLRLGGRYQQFLLDTGATHCACAHPRMPGVGAQWQAAPGRPGSPRLARWLLHGSQTYEAARTRYAPFDRLLDPDPAVRSELATASAAALREGRDVTVIANNKAEGSAPLTLRELAAALVRQLAAA